MSILSTAHTQLEQVKSLERAIRALRDSLGIDVADTTDIIQPIVSSEAPDAGTTTSASVSTPST